MSTEQNADLPDFLVVPALLRHLLQIDRVGRAPGTVSRLVPMLELKLLLAVLQRLALAAVIAQPATPVFQLALC